LIHQSSLLTFVRARAENVAGFLLDNSPLSVQFLFKFLSCKIEGKKQESIPEARNIAKGFMKR